MDTARPRQIELDSHPGYTPFRCGTAGQAHNEAAFRHFLGIELRRARRTGKPVVLVFVSMRNSHGRTDRISASDAEAVFSSLGTSVREVDFVGWFREERVAAAALVQRSTSTPDVAQRVVTRVTQVLGPRLRDASKLRIRVITLHGHSDS
jgi:hypothetical protein